MYRISGKKITAMAFILLDLFMVVLEGCVGGFQLSIAEFFTWLSSLTVAALERMDRSGPGYKR